MPAPLKTDILVIGGGPAGLAAATGMARSGLTVALARSAPAPQSSAADTRTAALFPPVIRMLRRLDAWDALAPSSAPLRGIRIVDQLGAFLRAPSVTFLAAEADLADLGFNVPNAALTQALEVAARTAGVLLLDDGPVVELAPASGEAEAVTAGRSRIAARLVVGADGKDSMARAAAGIEVNRWSYDQSALAATFTHGRPHRGISTELHRPMGPCTCVPLPGRRSSLVWVDRPGTIHRLQAAGEAEFLGELSSLFGDLLGELSHLGPRRSFPLTGLSAARMGSNRIALVGEAAHALPPIGAQGLNLGMFDVAALVGLVADARALGQDIGAPSLLQAYDDLRRTDMRLRQGAVDALNRTLTAGFLPLEMLRGAGLHVLAATPALRRGLIRRGLAPLSPLPALMAAGMATGNGPAAPMRSGHPA
jgi:2-octaprenyl-6-methoxyphenol hydroxylase